MGKMILIIMKLMENRLVNEIQSGYETIMLNLQNPTNGATIGVNGTQVILISDNDGVSIKEGINEF